MQYNFSSMRLYQIDLFRFIAAISVLLFHYTFRGFASDNMSILDFPELGKIFRYGYLGVDLFFIISGFVIILSIEKSNLSKFIQSRIIRLYPAYWFCLTITFLTMVFFGHPYYSATVPQYMVNLTMFQRFLGIEHIDGVYWTLLVEMKFYFLIALYLIIRSQKNISIDYFIYTWLAVSLLPLIIDFEASLPLRAIYFILGLNFSHYFIAGMLFYKIHTTGNKPFYLTGLALSLVLAVINGIKYLDLQYVYLKVHLSPVVVSAVIVAIFAMMYMVSAGWLNRANSPSFLKIGVLTYPLYLIHQNTGFIIFNNLGHTVNKYLLLTVTIVFMISVSYIINRFIEVPLARFLKRKTDPLVKKTF